MAWIQVLSIFVDPIAAILVLLSALPSLPCPLLHLPFFHCPAPCPPCPPPIALPLATPALFSPRCSAPCPTCFVFIALQLGGGDYTKIVEFVRLQASQVSVVPRATFLSSTFIFKFSVAQAEGYPCASVSFLRFIASGWFKANRAKRAIGSICLSVVTIA